MAIQRESFYNDIGHLTERGIKTTKSVGKVFERLFRKAQTPREAMDLERALKGDLSIACSLRILHFQCKKLGKGKGK
jgi:hypothetical protein